MYNPEDDLRSRWFQERDEAIERALEPHPVSSGMQSQDAKPEEEESEFVGFGRMFHWFFNQRS